MPASTTGAGQIVALTTKQMPVAVSQQLEPAPAGAQLFWQSRSLAQVGTHWGPLDELGPAADAEPAPPAPPEPVKSSESLPEAQAMTTPEGKRASASTVILAYFTGL
jgi:hypothetical protein